MYARCQDPYAETPDGYQTALHFGEATWGTCQTIRHRPCRSPPKNRRVGSRLLMATCAHRAAAMQVTHSSLHNARDRKSYSTGSELNGIEGVGVEDWERVRENVAGNAVLRSS